MGKSNSFRVIFWTSFVSILIMAALLSFAAHLYFAPSKSDVTSNRAYWGGYRPEGIYLLQKDLFIESGNGHHVLRIPKNPPLEELIASPQKWPELKVLATGSQIRITRIESGKSFETSRLEVHATIIGGNMSGIDVELSQVSEFTAEWTLSPDPRCLK